MSRQDPHLFYSFVVVFALTASRCGFFDEGLPTTETPEPGTTTSIVSSWSPSVPTPYPSPTTGITAPGVNSPSAGSELTELQPTLVVSNAATEDAVTLTYLFEVANDSSFSDIVASIADITQGADGYTSWQVPERLENGKYFWRCRARAGLLKSPYSDVADFTIKPSIEPPPPGGDVVIDPLTNGSSVGDVHGGSFVAEGWKVTARGDYIRYEIPSLTNGFVEWDNHGLRPMNADPGHFMLFGMWDPTRGNYRTNPFRVHIQKLDTNHNPPYIRLRWISDGEQHDIGYNFLGWNPQQQYHWRIEWGSEGTGHIVWVFLDGQVIIEESYNRSYSPDVHWVELGIAERDESIVGAVYANVRIGAR